MNIGFDARLINETGVGRYIQNVLPRLIKYSSAKNKFVIIIRPAERKLLESVLPTGAANIEIIEFNYRWHGFLEQILLPFYLYKRRLNVFHTPYINVPVLYFGRKVVTIHDLTVLTEKTGKASTKNSLYYAIKRLGFKIALKSALSSRTIFTVTSSVKQDILDNFPKCNPDKIVVAHNGFTELPSKPSIALEDKLNSLKPYFLYVGNAHPHKNLEFLIDSLESFFARFPRHRLVLAGRDDFFMKRLKDYVKSKEFSKNYVFIDSPTDNQLFHLYTNSKAVFLPSLKEGFGMQILEAMQTGSFIVCSRIPPYVEVAGQSAFYFNPKSKRSFMLCIAKMLKTTKTEEIKIKKAYSSKIKNYSWDDTAKKILRSYTNNNQEKSKKLFVNT